MNVLFAFSIRTRGSSLDCITDQASPIRGIRSPNRPLRGLGARSAEASIRHRWLARRDAQRECYCCIVLWLLGRALRNASDSNCGPEWLVCRICYLILNLSLDSKSQQDVACRLQSLFAMTVRDSGDARHAFWPSYG